MDLSRGSRIIMSGINEWGEEIFYPGEKSSKWERFWYGSSMFGGGFADIIGPFLMIVGFTIFAIVFLR